MRDEFSSEVIRILAKRAGTPCSNPNCRQPTSGPTLHPDKAVNIGVAAHITAASPGGPRYDQSMSTDTRSSIVNGIWLCQTCAKLIDSDNDRYTIALLGQWKVSVVVEAAASLQSGRPSTAPTINAAVLIQGEGAIRITGPNAVNIAPGGITIVGPVIRKN